MGFCYKVTKRADISLKRYRFVLTPAFFSLFLYNEIPEDHIPVREQERKREDVIALRN